MNFWPKITIEHFLKVTNMGCLFILVTDFIESSRCPGVAVIKLSCKLAVRQRSRRPLLTKHNTVEMQLCSISPISLF